MKRTLICAVGLLAVAGCTGSSSSASPTTLPALSSAPPTVAPTTAPASAVPVVTKPPKADAPTRPGAEAFARYWIAVLNAAFKTLDPVPLERISDGKCLTCASFSRSLRDSAKKQESYVGGQIAVTEAVAAPLEHGTADVLLNYRVPKLMVVGRNGSLVTTVPEKRNGTLQFQLAWRPTGWIAIEVAAL